MRSPVATAVLWITIPFMAVAMFSWPLWADALARYVLQWGWVAVAGLVIAVIYGIPITNLRSARFLERLFAIAAVGAAVLICMCLLGAHSHCQIQLAYWVFRSDPRAYYFYDDAGPPPSFLQILPQVEWLNAAFVLLLLNPVLLLGYALSRRLVAIRLRDNHHCLECGYDLTGNTSGVCPECGTAINLAIAHP